MKIFAPLALILLFAVAEFSQAGKGDCSQISVSGPAAVPISGSPVPYTLTMTGEPDVSGLDILWSTSNGKIVRGKDARQATIVDWIENKAITVAVEIKGVPNGCPTTASETMWIDPPPQPRLVDEYGTTSFEEVKTYLLDSAAKGLNEHQPPYPAKFRKVRIGHIGDVTKSGSYRLCGEFLPTDGGPKTEWNGFATVKTSGYEQYLGTTAYCTDKKIKWDTEGDLASVLQGKLEAIKKAQ